LTESKHRRDIDEKESHDRETIETEAKKFREEMQNHRMFLRAKLHVMVEKQFKDKRVGFWPIHPPGDSNQAGVELVLCQTACLKLRPTPGCLSTSIEPLIIWRRELLAFHSVQADVSFERTFHVSFFVEPSSPKKPDDLPCGIRHRSYLCDSGVDRDLLVALFQHTIVADSQRRFETSLLMDVDEIYQFHTHVIGDSPNIPCTLVLSSKHLVLTSSHPLDLPRRQWLLYLGDIKAITLSNTHNESSIIKIQSSMLPQQHAVLETILPCSADLVAAEILRGAGLCGSVPPEVIRVDAFIF